MNVLKNNTLAPICLFTYTRFNETQNTILALKNNYLASHSDLIIFSDGPKNKVDLIKIEKLRLFLETVSGFKSIRIVESEVNKGLARSIIEGTTQIILKYGKVIVIEDDLVTSPNFLDFMNQSLDAFQEDKRIQSVNGFSLKVPCKEGDIYVQSRPYSWGWATWKDRWSIDIFNRKGSNQAVFTNKIIAKKFNNLCGSDALRMLQDSNQGKINSWYAWWIYDHFLNGTYSIYPFLSKVKNIGFEENGTHCVGIDVFTSEFDMDNKRTFDLTVSKRNEDLDKTFKYYFTREYRFLFRINMLKTREGRAKVIRDFNERLLKKAGI